MDFDSKVSFLESKLKPNFKMLGEPLENIDENNTKPKNRSFTTFFTKKEKPSKPKKEESTKNPFKESIFQQRKLIQTKTSIEQLNPNPNPPKPIEPPIQNTNKINIPSNNIPSSSNEDNNSQPKSILENLNPIQQDIKSQIPSIEENNIIINNNKTELSQINENEQPIQNQLPPQTEIDVISILRDRSLTESKEYENIIKNNPDKLFQHINKDIIEKWKMILISKNTFTDQTITSITSPSELKNILHQKIIQNDINRTRLRESVLIPSFSHHLPLYITYYLKLNGIEYKQGLNEIIGAMLLLNYKHSLSITETFNLTQGFINKFLTNYYRDTDMITVTSSMSLIKLLLKYHNPQLFNYFESLEIQPEMYTMNWFMTTYAGKLHLHILYSLWNRMIQSNDSMILHYMIVAFLVYHKEMLMSVHYSLVVVVLSQLNIYNEDEVDKIFNIALELRKRTPYSFKVLANKLEIFKENSTNIKKLYNLIKPNEFVSLPIFPKEVLYLAYNSSVKCPNEDCYKGDTIMRKGPICDHCDLHIDKDIKYIFVDLRIVNNDKNTCSNDHYNTNGFLPNMIMIEQSELCLSNVNEILFKRFRKEKGKYHFVFITSHTDYFKDYEDNFYELNNNLDYMDTNILVPCYRTTVNKKLSIHRKTLKLMTNEEKAKLQEYDIFKRILETFTKQNIQYVSFCYGGFTAIHEQSILYDITLLNHDSNCRLCNTLRKNDNLKLLTKIERMFLSKHKHEEHNQEENVNNCENQEKKVFMNNTTEELISGNKDCQSVNLGDITQFICYSEFSMFFALLKDGNENEIKQEIMVMVKDSNIVIYKFSQLASDELHKIENIDIGKICSIIPMKRSKNIVVMKYNNANQRSKYYFIKIEKSIIIDFLSETDSKKFIYTINQRKKQLT